MKKITCLFVLVCFLITLSTSAFAWDDRSHRRPHPGREIDLSRISVWQDDNDFRLKTTTYRFNHVFTGTITTDGRFYNIENRELEHGDYVRVDRDRNTIRFRLTGRGVDEISFKARGGDKVTFNLHKDGHAMNTKEIFIGKNGRHPRDNRFTLRY